MASRAPATLASSKVMYGFKKWFYSLCGFNKLGLMSDDTIREDKDVKEAVKRLPEKLYDERIFRIQRALDLTMKHKILPKEEWTKYEDEVPYLQPYLDEVIRERKEREEWMKK